MRVKQFTLMAAMLGATLLATGAHAAAKWDGADDLPTNPLPCDGGAGTVAAKPYDGATPTKAPDRAGKPLTLVDVAEAHRHRLLQRHQQGDAAGRR